MKPFIILLLSVISWTIDCEELGLENGVLCLFKTAEERQRLADNVIPGLVKLGLRPVLRSMDTPPGDADLAGNRAVLTWFADGLYAYPEKYLDFLASALDKGKKAVIIGGLGAYGRKTGDEVVYLGNDYYNKVFIRMGLAFRGYWTGDPGVLGIVHSDKEMAEKNAAQDPSEARHYFKIENVDVRNDVHLAIRRTDFRKEGLDSGDSTVMVTGPRGGFCLESYDARWVDGKHVTMIDLPRFIERSLFHDDGAQRFLVIRDSANRTPGYAEYFDNVERALELAKLDYDTLDIERCKHAVLSDLYAYDAVLLGIRDYSRLPDSLFIAYVAGGGRLAGLGAFGTGGLSGLFGIRQVSLTANRCKSILTDRQFLLAGENYGRFDGFDILVRDVELYDGAEVYWELEHDKGCTPLVWEFEFGEGKTLFWNGDLPGSDRNTRSLVLESVLKVTDVCASGLANVGMLWMDDCPAPLWNTNYREYHTKRLKDELPAASESRRVEIEKLLGRIERNYPDELDTDFMEKAWIPDMFGILERNDLPMSFFLIFNYEAEVTPPFDAGEFYIAKNSLSVELGRRILREGYELGLHGFSHEPLSLGHASLPEAVPWNRENMVAALVAAREEWTGLFGGHTLPVSYVAPYNVIEPEGMAALGKAFPSVITIGTMYHKGVYETDMDFGYVDTNPGLYSLPRSSSGYGLIGAEKFNLLVALGNIGVLSHFLHPDDYADEERSFGYMGWKYMRGQFENLVATVKRNYPWLEFFQVRDARDVIARYANKGVLVRKLGDRIEIDVNQGPGERGYFFRVRFGERKFKSAENCTQVFAYPGGTDIIFKTGKPKCTVFLD